MTTKNRELLGLIERYLIAAIDNGVTISEYVKTEELLMNALSEQPFKSKDDIKEMFTDLRDYWDTLEVGK